MCKSYPERQLQKFVERLCTTTICKNRKHEKEFAKSAKNFSQRNLQKDCLEQQFAKILSRTTICQKWLSGMTICTKTNFGTIICTKWSIATICKNIVTNTKGLRILDCGWVLLFNFISSDLIGGNTLEVIWISIGGIIVLLLSSDLCQTKFSEHWDYQNMRKRSSIALHDVEN